MVHDTCLANARIIDGTGAPWFRGSVGVTDGTISTVTRRTPPDIDASNTVELEGMSIAPGFIDCHSHSDLELLDTPTLPPKIRQGVTTEILGQDGFSVAPIHSDKSSWQDRLSPLAGRTDEPWEWETVEEYFDCIDRAGTALNFGMLLGHGTLRFNVLGMDERAPSDEELERMRAHLREGLEQGALGLSTGLIYPPQAYASKEELGRLVGGLTTYGRPFVAHIRSEGRWIWDALDEFADIGKSETVPVHLSHYKLSGVEQQGKAHRSNSFIENARDRGIDFTAEQYPYTAGHTSLTAVLPPWVQSDTTEATKSILDDAEQRERIKRDVTEWRIEGWENVGALTGWDNVVVTNITDDGYAQFEGHLIAEMASSLQLDPLDAVCDLLLATDLDVGIIVHSMADEDVHDIMQNERVAVASDGIFGEHPHPRLFGTFPRVLGTYVRERNLVTLEEAIRKMTSLPARIMGLNRKGIIRPGMDADLVMFDPATVGSQADFDDPRQFPTGIEHVMVNGELVVFEGEVTDERPGEAIRA